MQMTGIEAYEGRWEENIIPTQGTTYRITTTSKLDEGLHQDVWLTYGCDKINLYLGDVIESGPIIGEHKTKRIIVFKVKDVMPIKNILTSFPESEYPKMLDDEFNSLLDGCGWFGNKLTIEQTATDTYSLNIDYYGNYTEIIVTKYEEKLYAWLTQTGFGLYRYYFGKYVLPDWIKDLIEHPEENGHVNYDLEE